MDASTDSATICRVRVDAYGSNAEICSRVLHDHAHGIEQLLGVSVARGEEVIQRKLGEPEGTIFAYEGRLLLHPDISVPSPIMPPTG